MTDAVAIVLIVLAALILVLATMAKMQKRKRAVVALPDTDKKILQEQVPFYNALNPEQKKAFENRVEQFLSQVRITGVNTEVAQLDRILIAASAIIPIFSFPNWEYTNLNEVLLYPETFSEGFAQSGNDRTVLGMVGTGAMQNVMILSQHELRQGFMNRTGKTNTAIHEFVHLVDKTDGSTDGLPENLVPHRYITPWLQLMHRNIAAMRKGKSDINPYGATNEAEFFAVASEYFFERPDLLQEKHPELYQMLDAIFHPQKREV